MENWVDTKIQLFAFRTNKNSNALFISMGNLIDNQPSKQQLFFWYSSRRRHRERSNFSLSCQSFLGLNWREQFEVKMKKLLLKVRQQPQTRVFHVACETTAQNCTKVCVLRNIDTWFFKFYFKTSSKSDCMWASIRAEILSCFYIALFYISG